MPKKKDEPVILHHYKRRGEDGDDHEVDMVRLPESRAANYEVRITRFHTVLKHGQDHREGETMVDTFMELDKANAYFLKKINECVK